MQELLINICLDCPLKHEDEFGWYCGHPDGKAHPIILSELHADCNLKNSALTIKIKSNDQSNDDRDGR